MATIIQNTTHAASRATTRSTEPSAVDLTRGAHSHDIKNIRVFVKANLLSDYAELDASVGLNLQGVILSVLARHLALNPGGTHDDRITIGAIRRDDGVPVELSLMIQRSCRRGTEHIVLVKGEEWPIEVSERHLTCG